MSKINEIEKRHIGQLRADDWKLFDDTTWLIARLRKAEALLRETMTRLRHASLSSAAIDAYFAENADE